MMRSVSMSSKTRGMAVPERRSIFCMVFDRGCWRKSRGIVSAALMSCVRLLVSGGARAELFADVGDAAFQGRGRHHRRTHQQRAADRAPLPSLEVAVARRGTHLAAHQLVGIHR